ncbi:hypothetical protein Acr_00g0015990 [Actinidia rufa]|uniref:Uncharacterized protein n=1 Tax=Actinidia rufa TaxID=165716 RepID=A0A7J0DAS1_9ERIC|nr:hypothetical protein Acr_00g0015990 [Actinidia rufa]
MAEEKQLQIKVHHHRSSSSPLPPTKIYQPFKTHFTWLVPSFVITNIILFKWSRCTSTTAQKNSPKCLGADLLGRFAFQNLKENPLLGPSGAT